MLEFLDCIHRQFSARYVTPDSFFSLTTDCSAAVSANRPDDRLALSPNERLHRDRPLIFGEENQLLRTFLEPLDHFSVDEIFPLGIFGPSGTGKSEIARWLARTHFAHLELTTTTATDFFRDFVEAMDLGNVRDFRRSLCAPDRLVILDNLQELATRPRVLNELEYLLEHAPHLIVTCSVNPAELPQFPYRLTSRILGGLSIQVAPPSTGIRQEILRHELSQHQARIDDDALAWLATHAATTIPEIKQVMARLRIEVNFRRPITLALVRKVFGNLAADVPSLTDLTTLIARQQRLKVGDLKGQSRKRSMVQARGMAIYIARQEFQYKYEELGRFFGNRDHSTIMHAHRKFQDQLLTDPELRKNIDEITARIQNAPRRQKRTSNTARRSAAVPRRSARERS